MFSVGKHKIKTPMRVSVSIIQRCGHIITDPGPKDMEMHDHGPSGGLGVMSCHSLCDLSVAVDGLVSVSVTMFSIPELLSGLYVNTPFCI